MNNRYELKLRSETKSAPPQKPVRRRAYISSIFCLLLLCSVSILKIWDTDNSRAALEKLEALIESQVDVTESVEAVMQRLVAEAEKLTGKELNVLSRSGESLQLCAPVSGGIISEGFVESEHPIFGTNVSPTGVCITTEPNAMVYSCANSVVTSVVGNADSSYTVTAEYDEHTSIVYKNLSYVYVADGDLIREQQIIGLLGGVDSGELKLELWVDNVAVDPQPYIKAGEVANES